MVTSLKQSSNLMSKRRRAKNLQTMPILKASGLFSTRLPKSPIAAAKHYFAFQRQVRELARKRKLSRHQSSMLLYNSEIMFRLAKKSVHSQQDLAEYQYRRKLSVDIFRSAKVIEHVATLLGKSHLRSIKQLARKDPRLLAMWINGEYRFVPSPPAFFRSPKVIMAINFIRAYSEKMPGQKNTLNAINGLVSHFK